MKIVINNRKAFHHYEVFDKFESGIALLGTEVKSLRSGRGNLTDAWVDIDKDGIMFLYSFHISPYKYGNIVNHEPKRVRQLLMHRREIQKLAAKKNEKGLTLIPLKIYLKRSLFKVEIALTKGKKHFDKREAEKTKDAKRMISRVMKQQYS